MRTTRLWPAFGLFLVLLQISQSFAEEDMADGEGDMSIHSCKVESCAGWRLNKLPEVKRFIHEDLEKNYERTTFKKIPGKSPEMVFYNENGEELERIDITKMTRSELNALITAKGIPAKGGKHDEV